MVTNQIVVVPSGAAMLVSTSAESLVSCPHCGEGIVLDEIESVPGSRALSCPHCRQGSLLVRLVSVLHRAVRWPEELLAQLVGSDAEPHSGVRMPGEVFTLPVSRGATSLLTLLWHRAEREGSTTVAASVNQLAKRLRSTRPVIRTWLAELKSADAIRERVQDEGPRRWELLPIGKEGDDDRSNR